MGMILNDNIKINVGKPIDSKYLSSGNVPYTSISAVNSAISISLRYIGLTVNINNVDYWYKDDVSDGDLIEKIYNTIIPTSRYITGGTNVGYFSGLSGVLTLPIDHLGDDKFDGNYNSLYNYYYRGIDGIIHIGTPTDGIDKRGFLKSSGFVKSWIWNEYIGGSDLLGWILIDGNISESIGTFQYSSYPPYYDGTTTFPYTESGFTGGSLYNNGSNLVINIVTGSLNTGSTITVGGRPFDFENNNNLHFRTIISDTPSSINVTDDEAFIHISGKTVAYDAKNISNYGFGVYSGTTGTTFLFRTLVPSGDTVIINEGRDLIISTAGQYAKYNLSSPAGITLGGINAGALLTGKTSFELFEQLLVPTQYPTLTNPSVLIDLVVNDTPNSSPYEIGRTLSSACFYGCFDAGCIIPQYGAHSDKRSCGVYEYCYIGPSLNASYSTNNTCDPHDISGYVVTSGAQTWQAYSKYCNGVQPYDSKGNVYGTPLTTGSTTCSTVTIEGILPWYWGFSDSINVNGTCVASCGYNGLGEKCVENVTSDEIRILLLPNCSNYIWFALPSCADDKSYWFLDAITGSGSGLINRAGGLFSAPYICTVSSSEGCWTGCNYNIYVSCYKTEFGPYTLMYIG